MQNGAVRRDGGVLVRGADEVQRPDDVVAERDEGSSGEGEVELAVGALLEDHAGGAVLAGEGERGRGRDGERRVQGDERVQRGTAVLREDIEGAFVGFDVAGLEVQRARGDEARDVRDAVLAERHLEESRGGEDLVVAREAAFEAELELGAAVYRRTEADADIAGEVAVDHGEAAEDQVAAAPEGDGLRGGALEG